MRIKLGGYFDNYTEEKKINKNTMNFDVFRKFRSKTRLLIIILIAMIFLIPSYCYYSDQNIIYEKIYSTEDNSIHISQLNHNNKVIILSSVDNGFSYKTKVSVSINSQNKILSNQILTLHTFISYVEDSDIPSYHIEKFSIVINSQTDISIQILDLQSTENKTSRYNLLTVSVRDSRLPLSLLKIHNSLNIIFTLQTLIILYILQLLILSSLVVLIMVMINIIKKKR